MITIILINLVLGILMMILGKQQRLTSNIFRVFVDELKGTLMYLVLAITLINNRVKPYLRGDLKIEVGLLKV